MDESVFMFPLTTVSGDLAMKDAKYLAYLGLSLTSFMASALFVMVAMNPKDPSYSALPVIYAVGSFLIGIVTNLLARKAASPTMPTTVSPNIQTSAAPGE
jgi:predicted neutral ceramidase superfamily lipid hydrolase